MKWIFSCQMVLMLASLFAGAGSYGSTGYKTDPYRFQIAQAKAHLASPAPSVRASAIETLSFLRAYGQAGVVAKSLADPTAAVRREAAMNLGWTGNRNSLKPLAAALGDPDWSVAQAAAVALENLTAKHLPFDALAEKAIRATQATAWRDFVAAFQPASLSAELKIAMAGADLYRRADVLRAIGFMKLRAAVPAVLAAMKPFVTKKYPATSETTTERYRPEKTYAQAGIRTLGRLATPDSRALLIQILRKNTNYAVYAVEALGDVNDEKSAAALLEALPQFAYKFNRAKARSTNKGFVDRSPVYDGPRLSSVDRIPWPAHMILHSLARMDFTSPANRAALAKLTPYLLSTMPNSFDATIVYTPEPWQALAGYLLERAGHRRYAVDAALTALGIPGRALPKTFAHKAIFEKLAADWAKGTENHITRPPYAGMILMSCCDKRDIAPLIQLLDHPNGFIKIHAAKTLAFLDAKQAIAPLSKRLAKAKDDADYGFCQDFDRYSLNYLSKADRIRIFGKARSGEGFDEYNDPAPRYKEAYLYALGILCAKSETKLLAGYLNNERNVIEIQYAAAQALAMLAAPEALAALRTAERDHPIAIVNIAAREAIYRAGILPLAATSKAKTRTLVQLPIPAGAPKEIVFIRGPHIPGNSDQISLDRAAYSVSDPGPTYRLGRNIYRIKTADPKGSLRPLTKFKTGWVADLEVSYDGKKLLFCHCKSPTDPWYHVYEMNADGSGLRQITRGPYHHVQPNYMPDGRIVFSTTRGGTRDEYHGYASTSLAVMNDDGSDIHIIGLNLGRDAEAVVGDDGKILFSRLELFYSRMKTEWNLLSVFPDGRGPLTLYGPERRDLFREIPGAMGMNPPRHRVLRITQPQPWGASSYLCNTHSGPFVTKGALGERFLRPNNDWAVNTPYPLSKTKLLVAAGKRGTLKSTDQFLNPPKRKPVRKKTAVKAKSKPKPKVNPKAVAKSKAYFNAAVDYGLFYLDVATGKLKLIYNDPKTAEFEARPLRPRKIPQILPESLATRKRGYTGTILCNSAFLTRHPSVASRGKFVRLIEGQPTVARHQTHQNGGVAWRNHGGAVGRVWGTTPLAADGSFALEIPADRLFHVQVLDSDKRVLGNEWLWQHVRPGEKRGCVGCHESAETTTTTTAIKRFPAAHRQTPIRMLPQPGDMLYRAKMWFKGWGPDEREERMRTVNSTNILGRQ